MRFRVFQQLFRLYIQDILLAHYDTNLFLIFIIYYLTKTRKHIDCDILAPDAVTLAIYFHSREYDLRFTSVGDKCHCHLSSRGTLFI